MRKQPIKRREWLKLVGIGTAGIAGTVNAGATTETAADSEHATEIEDWHDLNDMRHDRYSDYVLVNDLNEETAGHDQHVSDPNGGWEPIGNNAFPFQGTLDGDGNRISDLVIDRSDEDYVGLFGVLDGHVERLGLTDTSVTGGDQTAVLAGENRGEVTETFAGGTVTGENYVGGLVGRNAGGTIEATYATVTTTGEGIRGGLVGTNARGTVSESFAAGEED